MRRLFIALSLIVTLGIASANGTFTVNDTNFDYGDTDIETAYVQLDYLDGDLQLILSDEMLDGSLPAIATVVPGTRITAMDDEILPEFEDLGYVGLWKAGRDVDGFSVLHEGTKLDAVVGDYLAVMSDLGFDATLEAATLNSTCYLFSQDGTTVRAIFKPESIDGLNTVQAYLRYW